MVNTKHKFVCIVIVYCIVRQKEIKKLNPPKPLNIHKTQNNQRSSASHFLERESSEKIEPN